MRRITKNLVLPHESSADSLHRTNSVMSLKAIVKEDTAIGRVFGLFIQSLIVISIISFSIETLPDLDDTTQRILDLIEIVIVVVFTFEYLLHIYAEENKIHYLFSFYGIIDLIAIVPFYLTLGFDLKCLRILRMLRLFRLLKLVRYSKALQRLRRAFSIVKEELMIFGVVAAMLLYLSSAGIYFFENEAQPEQFKSIFHSLWWAVATLTTVGYGDIYPITTGGKIFTFLILIIGLGIVSALAGLIATALLKAMSEENNTG